MKKRDKTNKDQKELFDTKKFYRTTSFPQSWYELLSNHDEDFLSEILFDVQSINLIENKLILTFGNSTSYNFFRLSMLNENSRKKIEKIFKGIYGDDVTVAIVTATKRTPKGTDKREKDAWN